MEVLRLILVFIHFLGLSALIGGVLAQTFGADIRRAGIAVLHGSLTQLVTGLALVGLHDGPLDDPVDHVKITVKLLITLVIVVLAALARRRGEGGAGGYRAAGLLAVLNVGIAVFWT